jgi:hypothetical protein
LAEKKKEQSQKWKKFEEDWDLILKMYAGRVRRIPKKERDKR